MSYEELENCDVCGKMYYDTCTSYCEMRGRIRSNGDKSILEKENSELKELYSALKNENALLKEEIAYLTINKLQI